MDSCCAQAQTANEEQTISAVEQVMLPIQLLDGTTYMPEEGEVTYVTAADFNPQNASFDGAPLLPLQGWIHAVVDEGRILIEYDGRDYAVFEVHTEHGVVLAEPDNKIMYTDGKLYVVIDGKVVEGMDPVPRKVGTLSLGK